MQIQTTIPQDPETRFHDIWNAKQVHLQNELKEAKDNNAKRFVQSKIDDLTFQKMEIESIVLYICRNYDTVSSIISRNYHLVDDFTRTILDRISYVFCIFPEFILILASSIPFIDVGYLDFMDIKNVAEKDKFHLLKDSFHCHDSKSRYLHAMSNTLLTRKETPNPNSIYRCDTYLNSKIFLNVVYQTRFSTIWKQLGMILLASKSESPHDYLPNVRIAPSAIANILRQFDSFPFYNRPGKGLVILPTNRTWNVTMLPFLYSMMELAIDEIGDVVDRDLALIIVKLRNEQARTSIETRVLEIKEMFANLPNYLHAKLKLKARLYSNKEHSEHRFIQSIPTDIDETKVNDWNEPMRNWINIKINNALEYDITDTEHEYELRKLRIARQIIMAAHSYVNPGLYCKTATTLDAEKSIAPKLDVGITKSVPPLESTQIADGFIVFTKLDWDKATPITKLIREKYRNRIRKYWDKVFSKDIRKEFVLMLTNNSQGHKVPLEAYDPNIQFSDPYRKGLLENVRSSRLPAYLLDQNVYADKILMHLNLQMEGMCATRDQVIRRTRVIEVMPNEEQTGYTPPLLLFNEMKQDNEGIAVGKQQGGIVDLYDQCHYTGMPNIMNLYSDVVAMDASTTASIGRLTLQIIAEELIENDVSQERYMCWRTQKFTNSNGHEISIPAIAQCLLTVATYRMTKKFTLKDRVAGATISVSSQVFPSGRADTSANHTIILDILAEIVWEGVTKRYQSSILMKRSFGDDSYNTLQFAGRIDEEMVTYYVDSTKQVFNSVGYNVEAIKSEVYADFLQQSAYAGGYCPKRARATVFTDERGDTRNKDPKSQIDTVISVVLPALQRTNSPEEGMSLIRVAWVAMRTIRMHGNVKGRFAKRVRNAGYGKFLFTYPYEYPFYSNLSAPAQPMKFGEITIPSTGPVKLVGDNRKVWLYNYLLSLEEFKDLEKTDVTVKPIEPWTIIGPILENTGIIDSLILYKYNRSNRLGRKRESALEHDIDRFVEEMKVAFEPSRLITSQSADIALKRVNISLPDKLLYWKEPRLRVLDSFAKKMEDKEESTSLDIDFVNYLNYFAKRVHGSIIDDFNNLSFRIVVTNVPCDYIQTNLSSYHLMPGYADTTTHVSNFNKLFRVSRSPFSSMLTRAPLVAMMNKYGGKFDVKAAIGYGLAAMKRGPAIFEVFRQAINLPRNLESEFMSLVSNPANVQFFEIYETSLQPDASFGIARSADNFSDLVIVPRTSRNLLKALMEQVGYDFLVNKLQFWDYRKVSVIPSAHTSKKLMRQKWILG